MTQMCLYLLLKVTDKELKFCPLILNSLLLVTCDFWDLWLSGSDESSNKHPGEKEGAALF